MKFEDYLDVARSGWRVILLFAGVTLLFALAFFILRPSTYTATMQLYVATQNTSDPQQAFQAAQLSQKRVSSYTELVTSPRILDQVRANLGLPYSNEQLSSAISASATTDSVIIDLEVSDESPTRAADIANSTSAAFATLVNDLESPQARQGSAPVAIKIVEPASPPDRPSSLGLLATLSVAILLGLVLGYLVAFGRRTLDKTVRMSSDVEASVDVPLIGMLPYESDISEDPLAMVNKQSGSYTEAVRQIRTNLSFLDVDSPKRVIVVTSPNQSEGKSTAIVNLGIALSAAGYRVLLVDADLRRPRIADLLQLEANVGLTDLLASRASLEDLRQVWSRGSRIDVLASGTTPPNPNELLSSAQMVNFIERARTLYDYVLIDTPPALPVADAQSVSLASDGVIVLARYASTKKEELSAVAAKFSQRNILLGIILSAIPIASISYGRSSYYGTASSKIRANEVNDAPAGSAQLNPPKSAAKPRASDVTDTISTSPSRRR